MQRLLVVGSEGFIGKHLSISLEEDFEIEGVDLPEFDLRKPDTIKNFFEEQAAVQPYFALINCAGIMDATISRESPDLFYDINGLKVLDLIQLAENFGVKNFIHLSSETVFGTSDYPKLDTDPRVPIHPYGISKLLSELLIASKDWTDIESWVLRLPVIVGLEQGLANPISLFVSEAKEKQTVTLFNGGKHKRKFLHVNDLALCIKAVLQFAELNDMRSKMPSEFNLPGFVASMEEIAAAVLQKDGNCHLVSQKSERQAFTLISNSELFERTFGITPNIAIEEMVDQFWKARP